MARAVHPGKSSQAAVQCVAKLPHRVLFALIFEITSGSCTAIQGAFQQTSHMD